MTVVGHWGVLGRMKDEIYCLLLSPSFVFPRRSTSVYSLWLIHDDTANCRTVNHDQFERRIRHFSLDYLTIHLVNLVLVVRPAPLPIRASCTVVQQNYYVGQGVRAD